MFGPGGSFFVWGRDEWRDERTVCQRGGCMVVPGAVVSPGHTKRLSLLPCRVPFRQVPQAPSMTSGLLRRTGSRLCSRPAGSLSVLVFGGVRAWWSDGSG